MTRSSRSFGRDSRQQTGSGSRRSGTGHRLRGDRHTGAPSAQPGSAMTGEFALPTGTTPALAAVAAFNDLDMPAALLTALTEQGLTTPFPIQAHTLPNSLAGRDVLGRGRTGSGKTIAFGLAVLTRVAGRRAESRRPVALVLVPTRELAQQVTEALTPYARVLRLRLATVVGGMSIGRQAHALRNGTEIVVGEIICMPSASRMFATSRSTTMNTM